MKCRLQWYQMDQTATISFTAERETVVMAEDSQMEYLTAGWNKFNFLISPKEMEQILTQYHLVISNEHVPVDYMESPISEYIQTYSQLYGLLMSGEKIIWKRDYPLFIHRAVTSDLLSCQYGHIHEYEGKQYKSADFDEPAVTISPFCLTFYKDSKQQTRCSTEYSYICYPEFFMGMQLSYPKKIQYQIKDGYEELKTTQGLKSFKDYEELKGAIKKITTPLTVVVSEGLKKVNVRISDEAKKKLNDCYSFRQNNVILK